MPTINDATVVASAKQTRKKKWTTESLQAEIDKRFNCEFTTLGEYEGATTKLLFKHLVCGHEWLQRPTHFLSGRLCPECTANRIIMNNRKTHDAFVSEVNDLVGDEYTVLSKYVNSKTKVRFKHNTCGFEWDGLPAHFTHNDRRCPQCVMPRGEKLIREYLTAENIPFKPQYRIKECASDAKYPLPFDFAVFDNSDNLKCLIEYDGRQHYYTVEIWDGKDGLERRKKHDQRKNEYCQKNNIPLIRIPYWQRHNIEKILSVLKRGDLSA